MNMIFVYNAAVARTNRQKEREEERRRLTFYEQTSLGRVSFALPVAAAAVGKLTFWRGTF